ncbi:MAG: hypothetical protein DMG41_05445 [Acidobacteria bacterium]|nr:MAG: hypothetical protein AUH13_28205 [Acidobacteria bacterium 13_2_20CM_58_27]PYT66694.1 MAG: hypothetical protein DMG42_28670 [Acidobacteriota bacterium]PYT90191.1 MAG: hypothetical protein DMG41_05445 [Acidobacteriota bacterium]
MKTAADLNQDRAAVAHAARIERGIREVYAAFPDLCVNDANSNMIRHWCSQFSGVQDAVPSVPLFRAARDANREEWRKTFVLKPIADQINGLIDEIVGMLRTHGSHSEKSLAAKKQNQLSCFSRQQLLDYRDQLRLKQEFNRLPASDLKQKLARFRESEARMASNALPEEWSASRLKGNVELLKHACRRFGVEAVNARLRGES